MLTNMLNRRILKEDHGHYEVVRESAIATERELQLAIAAHPEVLPNEDIGLGQLVGLATELDLGHGPMDLLACDAAGHIAIIEFKRGSENPDIRKLVAQVLDYGAALWGVTVEELESRCQSASGGIGGAIAIEDHVRESLGAKPEEWIDQNSCRTGLASSLADGDFVFFYVGRDLDPRSRRIMTYLSEGAHMSFFAVEIDQYVAPDHSRVLVPRTAFVPSWAVPVAGGGQGRVSPPTLSQLLESNAEAGELMRRMDDFIAELGGVVLHTTTGRRYEPSTGTGYVGVYATGRGVEVNLGALRSSGYAEEADEILDQLSTIAGKALLAPLYPSVSAERFLANWADDRETVVRRYFEVAVRTTGQED